MRFTRSRTLWLVAWLVLAALALRGASGIERVAELAFAPARIVAELALPFRLAARSGAVAAEGASEHSFATDAERARAFLLDAQRAALPRDPTLLQGRSLCVARVVGRAPRRADALIIRAPRGVEIQPGMGVVFGDAFVGRVESLSHTRADDALVALVTAADFRVGARVEGVEGATLVVGGLAVAPSSRSRVLHLSVHAPSDRRTLAGRVVVDEPTSASLGAFLRGFRLGELTFYEARGVRTLAVRAAIDYADGLSWVALVAGPEHALAGELLVEDPFEPGVWTDARVLVPGDASSGTCARTIDAASGGAIRTGAAVAVGAHFVGRVLAVRRLQAEIALLGDPRLELDALARVDGIAEPVALGRLRAVRAFDDGSIELVWDPRVPLPGATSDGANAELFTAAGESDLPAGLFVGRTRLPRGEGPFRLRVMPAIERWSRAQRVRVWCGPSADMEGRP